MSKRSIDSAEFQEILHNLRLENILLPIELQKKIIQIINSERIITPELIKKVVADANGEV